MAADNCNNKENHPNNTISYGNLHLRQKRQPAGNQQPSADRGIASMDFVSLLQQQQGMLEKVIKQQANISSKLEETDARILPIEKSVAQNQAEQQTTTPRANKRLPRELTVNTYFMIS